MTPERRANFQRLLRPRHIAFVGGRDATIAINEARRRGFAGQMWAVNPTRTELAGLPCVASIDDLPEAPDAVYLAIPAGGVVAALQTLAQMGAGGVVCFSAGFKETGDALAEQASDRRNRRHGADRAQLLRGYQLHRQCRPLVV